MPRFYKIFKYGLCEITNQRCNEDHNIDERMIIDCESCDTYINYIEKCKGIAGKTE